MPRYNGSSGGSTEDVFKTISVAGQSDVVADSSTDTLTFVAGSNMTITTDASETKLLLQQPGAVLYLCKRGGQQSSNCFKCLL